MRASARKDEKARNCFSLWSDDVAELTGISVRDDIYEPYVNLMNHLDTFQFDNKMAMDEALQVCPSWVSQQKQPRSNEHMRETATVAE